MRASAPVTEFLVKRDDLRVSRIASSKPPEVAPGGALLRVETFGLTSNNVTYAVMGEAMSYWEFFPAADVWGRVPMWGFAEVERSEADGVEPGTRVYGYLPPSSRLLVRPADADDRGFLDAAPHRASLPSAYQRYLSTATDPFYRPDTEETQMLLRPLFFTSFLIDDQLGDDGLTGRGPVLISSASSKTAIGAAFLLARRGVELVGLTSPRSAEFAAGLGIYDRTLTYEDIGSLAPGPATFVDVAGSVEGAPRGPLPLRRPAPRQHGRRAQPLAGFRRRGPAPRPDAGLLLCPRPRRQAVQRLGPGRARGAGRRRWHPFCEWAGGWLEVIRGRGFDAVRDAYLEVLEGRVDPRTAHVLTLA